MENYLNLDEAHELVIQQFEEYEHSTRNSRLQMEKAVDYFHDKQLTDVEVAKLEIRKQPPVVFNEIKPRVITMQGLEKQTRKDPKAYPRNPGDEGSATAATDALRYICDESRWDEKRSQSAWDLAVPGLAAMMVGVKKNRGAIDPDIRRIAWDRFYYDPASSEFDFADATYLGAATWMDLTEAQGKWPDAEEALNATWESARDSDTLGDKPKNGLWADYRRKRVRLCEHYWIKDGAWEFCIFTKGGFLVEPQPSPYVDDDQTPECPIKAVSLYVGRDNERYGEVQSMISPQDEVNKRRSKALHLINTRQVQAIDADVAMAADPYVVRKEAARPDGVLPPGWGISPTSDMASGNLLLLQDARAHIHRTGGGNNALAGKDTQGQSGKAIIAQQQGGMTEASNYLDIIRSLSLAVYRSTWARIKQHWTAERWVRVTDDERNLRFVGFNRPVTALEEAGKRLGIVEGKEADPQATMLMEAFAQDPRSQQVVSMENVPSEIDVDIVVDEGLDTPTLQAEQFSELVAMLPALGPLAQSIPVLEMVVEASSFRNKDKLLKILKEGQQGPSPEEQAMKQLAMAGAQGEVENTQADTAVKTATAQEKQFGIIKDAHEAGMAA